MDDKERLFLRVVEAGSLKAAAEQLRTDPSSVSRKIAALEARLGVKLLQRSTRQSVPTDAGSLYYEGLSKLSGEQAALEAKVSGTADIPEGLLRVTAPVDFGTRFVAPILQEMQAAYPELGVELLLGSNYIDLTAQGVDVAIRIGKLADTSLIGRKLGTVPRVLVASKSYIEKHGQPATHEDLKDHKFILYSPSPRPIEMITPDGQKIRQPITGNFMVNSVSSIRNLVCSGHGIHLGPMWAYKDELERGDLVTLLPDYQHEPFPIHALFHSAIYIPAKIRHFVDLMAKHAAW